MGDYTVEPNQVTLKKENPPKQIQSMPKSPEDEQQQQQQVESVRDKPVRIVTRFDEDVIHDDAPSGPTTLPLPDVADGESDPPQAKHTEQREPWYPHYADITMTETPDDPEWQEGDQSEWWPAKQ